jgi:hypothetical protein
MAATVSVAQFPQFSDGSWILIAAHGKLFIRRIGLYPLQVLQMLDHARDHLRLTSVRCLNLPHANIRRPSQPSKHLACSFRCMRASWAHHRCEIWHGKILCCTAIPSDGADKFLLSSVFLRRGVGLATIHKLS